MKRKSIIIVSLFLSVLVHVLFMGAAYYWQLPGMQETVERTKKMFDVKSVKIDLKQSTSRQMIENYVKKIKFQDPANKTKKKLGKIMRAKEKIKMPTAPKKWKKAQADIKPMDSLTEFQTLAHQLKEKVNIKKRTVVDKNSLKEINIGERWENFLAGINQEVDVPEEFVEEMLAFTPTIVAPMQTLLGAAAGGPATFEKAALDQSEEVAIIDDYLSIGLETYWDKKEQQGYYRLSLVPGPKSNELVVMPKEILFLVDASLSMQRKRLQSFKRGLKQILKNLNPQDRFNVITFKQKITPLAPESLTATPTNIDKALKFLDRLKAGQRTDFYRAFLDSIRGEASLLPSYVILLSDGRPNMGIVSPVEIIAEITKLNQKKRSIFAMSGGKRVNRFLLDFLSYENRGWSEYAQKEQMVDDRLFGLYEKIRNPLLTNVRFQVTGLEGLDVYPKHLPDIYQNASFVVYGKYEASKEFSVRILGESQGETKELIFAKDMREASDGGSEIAKFWALNKIYYLLGQVATTGFKPEILQEIQSLSQKYKIRTPYDI